MYLPKCTQDYIDYVKENEAACKEDAIQLFKKAAEKPIYHGKAIPITYQGMFFDKETILVFEEIIDTMIAIGRKVTDEFVRNPEYRKGFHFDDVTTDLILQDPGYDMPVAIGRYDIFYNGSTQDGAQRIDDFKFCELNTDGSSAMNEDRILGAMLEDTVAMRAIKEKYTVERFDLFRPLVDRMLAYYEQKKGEKPKRVAIVDFIDKGTTLEFEVFRDTFLEVGVECVIVDPSEMRYEEVDAGGLFHEKKLLAVDPQTGEKLPIDLVYRRVVTSDFVEEIAKCQPFLEAYKDQAFLMMGSFRSQVMHSKLIFSMLFHPRTKEILTAKENAFVENHVPYTAEILTQADKEKIKKHKDDYILKPYNSYASQGILLGREHDQASWNEKIDALPFDAFIYQEYVDVEPTPFVEFLGEDHHLEVNPMGHVIGLFTYLEQFSGSYTRVGKMGIISGARDYYSAPVFVMDARKE